MYDLHPADTQTIRNIAKYWDEPDTFKPSRFLGDWPRDAFMPFSTGARSCIGRRYGLAYRFVQNSSMLITSEY